MNAKAQEQEQAYLENVTARINDERCKLESQVSGDKTMMKRTAGEMWEDAPDAIRSFDDAISLTIYNQQIGETITHMHDMIRRLEQLKKMADRPYFGRVDFQEDGESEPEPVHVGIASLTDPDTLQALVCDWRAPVSSLFYDYGRGRAAYEVGGNIVNGEITLKRQYGFAKGRMDYAFDSDLVIEDELLCKTLAGGAENRLKTIVSTIQREQNRVIRDLEHKVMVVFGPAGSGKTSVALHRVAYLLYHRRDYYKSENILVLGNSDLFCEYISGVIPELGEDEIRRLNFSKFICGFFNGQYSRTDIRSMYEELIREPEGRRARAIIAKNDPELLRMLQSTANRYEPEFEDAVIAGRVLCSADEQRILYSEHYRDHAPFVRLSLIRTHIEKQIEYAQKELTAVILDGLDDEGRADDMMDMRAEVFFQREKDELLAGLDKKAQACAPKIYIDALACFTGTPDSEIYKTAAAALENGNPEIEDMVLIVYTRLLIGEIRPYAHITHLVVDEAQDYGRTAHMLLHRLFPNAGVTLLGDAQQALFPFLNGCKAEELAGIYGGKKVIELKKSYRSTVEINDFATGLLSTPQDTEYFCRHGAEPCILHPEDPEQALLGILHNLSGEEGITAVLTSTAGEAEACARMVKRQRKDISSSDGVWESADKRLLILPVYLAKGLEFDNCVLFGVPCPETADTYEKRRIYLMATRALHRLYVISAQEKHEKN